jgi:hypothetical protein
MKQKAPVAWFAREDWDEIKQLCTIDDLPDTYDEWFANAEADSASLAAQGVLVEKVRAKDAVGSRDQ